MEKKFHSVNWSIVCLEKHNGGLGFKSLHLFNKALLGKWSWRFVKERNPLWKLVIVGKYGMQEGGCTKEVRGRYGVGVWKLIRNGWEAFKDKTRFQVGLGNRVKFWKDRWCGDLSLRDEFLGLYAITSFKDAWVVDVWDGGSWRLRFIR